MCSINGIIYFNRVSRKELQDKICKMQEITKHRGPDQSDILLLDQAVLGISRLAIIAPTDNSTIKSMEIDKKYVVFNGEIVNYKKLRKLLNDPSINQKSDSALILPLFKKLGQNFIKELAGMFAIGVYDELNNRLQLWRDPLGIKPLYYYQSKNCIIFSSEIKAIYTVMDSEPELDFAALDHILRFRFQPGRSSVFPEIKKVLPGETIVFKKIGISSERYWKLVPNEISLNPKIQIEQFRNLLAQVIEEHAQADVPGGFFTSGGLDSSLVTSIALKVSSSSYKQPISIKFSPHSVVDEKYGQLLEKYLKTRFEWVTITDSIARQTLMELVRYIDEPLENPIHIGTYLMAKRARDLGIKSILTGDGSDEFFLGYERHGCWFKSPNPTRDYPKLHWTMKPEEAKEFYTHDANASIRPMVDCLNQKIEPFLNMEQALLFERGERLAEYHNMRLDRMTMAHGVEAKVPFLDHRIVEYALQIPVATLFGKSGKEWLQQVAKPWLPPEIMNRSKVLFPSLPDQWLSGNGAKWTAEILLSPNAYTRKWIKPRVLERYIVEHQNKIHSRGKLLWALVVLELWIQQLSLWRNLRIFEGGDILGCYGTSG